MAAEQKRMEAAGGPAVAYAKAQVGKSYVYGAMGPDSFDCSGLTMAAWKQAGVSLPHSSSAQYASGRQISESELQPGDLVFFNTMRRAFSHVGIYVGDGKFIHSPKPGAEVRVESMGVSYWQRRFDGARRVTPQGSASQDTAAQRTATLQASVKPAAQPAPDLQAANAATPPMTAAQQMQLLIQQEQFRR
jgi:uncharacterized protein YycO